RLELGDLLPQLFHLALQLGHRPRLATRTLPLRAGQGPGHHVVTHLFQPRRANAEPGTNFLHPTVAGQDLDRRLEALLGFIGSIQLVHVFPSCWITSTHGRVLSQSSAILPQRKQGALVRAADGWTDYPWSLVAGVVTLAAASGSTASGFSRAASVNARTTGL